MSETGHAGQHGCVATSAIGEATFDAARSFAGGFDRWFGRAGWPMEPSESVRLARTLSAEAPIDVLSGSAIVRALAAEEHDSLWWDADEGERERLWDIASDRVTEDELSDALSAAGRHRDAVHRAACASGAIAGDPLLLNAAIDAAVLALHHHALAELAGVPDDHWFRIKLALFESGRWPLGFRAGRFLIV